MEIEALNEDQATAFAAMPADAQAALAGKMEAYWRKVGRACAETARLDNSLRKMGASPVQREQIKKLHSDRIADIAKPGVVKADENPDAKPKENPRGGGLGGGRK